MDYRALGEFIFMALLGLSIFFAAAGLTIRLFLKPVLSELIGALKEGRSSRAGELRYDRLEMRLIEMEDELLRIRAEQDFDRRIEGSGPE